MTRGVSKHGLCVSCAMAGLLSGIESASAQEDSEALAKQLANPTFLFPAR
jgi:hypothetical protein